MVRASGNVFVIRLCLTCGPPQIVPLTSAKSYGRDTDILAIFFNALSMGEVK